MRVRKYKKARIAHRVILAICEGETEEEYIKLLKRHYRLPIAIKTKVTGNSINQRLINQYIVELGAEPTECSIFYIYDADVKAVLDKILMLPGRPIISNPCIEFWFVLHAKEIRHSLSSEAVVKELCATGQLWKSYSKGGFSNDQAAHLINNMEIAIARARKFEFLKNPSTNMYDFIETLESEKKLK